MNKLLGENTIIDPTARVRNSTIHSYARLKHYSELIDSTLGEYSYISQFSIVNKTHIGKFCSIANNVSIGLWQHDIDVTTHTFHLYETSGNFVKGYKSFKLDNVETIIGNDVWIGANSILMKGVTIGDGAIVGAGSVVTKDVEPYSIVFGNPARLYKKRYPDHTITFLLNTRWWNFSREKLKKIVEDRLFDNIETFISNVNNSKYEF